MSEESKSEGVRLDYVPVSDYSPEFHRLEMERVWPKTWQAACRVQELAEVGDYVNYEIGTESILVLRSDEDTIRAFYNVCPHRGRRLRDDARGNLSAIFCGYHAWTFDLEGRPTTIPAREDWDGCPAMSDDDLSLSRVACDTWAGWVWINMDPDCVSLAEYLGPIPSRLDRYEWEHARIRSHQTIIFPVNWKVAIEAFVEPYHVIATHPQLLRWGHGKAAPTEEYLTPEFQHAGHYGGRHYEFDEHAEFQDVREYLYTSAYNTYHTLHGLYHEEGLRAAERVRDEGPEGMTLSEASALMAKFRREEIIAKGARYPEGVTPLDQSIIEWLLFPNSSVLTTVEGAFWYRVRPNGDDPNSCIFQVIVLGRYAPGQEPKFEYEFYPTLEAFKGKNPILEQDFSNLIGVHKGLRSRGFKAARPNPVQESQVGNFHRVLHRYVYGAADFAKPLAMARDDATRVAWVTGGSAGIGLAIAKVLAEDGFLVVVSARHAGPLEQACTEIGGTAEALVCDVTDRAAVNAAAAEILSRHGRIDVLVNNAGFNSQKREWGDLIPEEFDAVIAANVTGSFNATHAVLPAMRAQRDGLVIMISSGAGKQVGVGAGVAYTIAKHGVHIMARLLNQSELKNGVRACVIAPGFVRTRAHDWRPEEMRQYMLDPAAVARAVRYAVDSPPGTATFEIELGWSPV